MFFVCCIFFSHYSHQQAGSTVTQENKKNMFMSVKMSRNDPKRKEGIAYLHQEVWGDSTFLLAVLTVFIHECLTAQFSRDL